VYSDLFPATNRPAGWLPRRRQRATEIAAEEETMNMMKHIIIAVSTIAIFLAPALCSGAEKILPRLVQMLRDGKATISPNKKSLVDEKGKVIAKEVDEKSVVKPASSVQEGLSEQKAITNCNYKCAIITRRCFADDSGTVACINTCDKETLVCE
jgi:hypothetical protein